MGTKVKYETETAATSDQNTSTIRRLVKRNNGARDTLNELYRLKNHIKAVKREYPGTHFIQCRLRRLLERIDREDELVRRLIGQQKVQYEELKNLRTDPERTPAEAAMAAAFPDPQTWEPSTPIMDSFFGEGWKEKARP